MKNLNEKNFWIWLAGFIDGDGCIYISKSKSSNSCGYQYVLRLEISQNNKKLLDEIKNRIGCGCTVRNRSKERWYVGWNGNNHHSNNCYGLKLSANKALEVLEKIYPYLQVKKEQVKFGIQFQQITKKAKFGPGKKAPKGYFDKQEEYLRIIKNLKITAP